MRSSHLRKRHHVPCTNNCCCCDKSNDSGVMIIIQNQIVNLPFKVQTLSQMFAASWTVMTSSPPMSARAAILLSKIQQTKYYMSIVDCQCNELPIITGGLLTVPPVFQYQKKKGRIHRSLHFCTENEKK